jgi:hypothetical protein
MAVDDSRLEAGVYVPLDAEPATFTPTLRSATRTSADGVLGDLDAPFFFDTSRTRTGVDFAAGDLLQVLVSP